MGEVLFENSFVRDKSTATEIVKKMLILSRIMKVAYVLFTVSLISTLLIGIIMSPVRSEFGWTSITTYVVLPLLLSLMSIVLRAQNIPAGGTSEEKFLIYRDKIEWSNAGKTIDIDIKDVAGYYESDNYFILIALAKKRLPMIPAIKKDSFSLGNGGEFKEFLKSKGIKIQK